MPRLQRRARCVQAAGMGLYSRSSDAGLCCTDGPIILDVDSEWYTQLTVLPSFPFYVLVLHHGCKIRSHPIIMIEDPAMDGNVGYGQWRQIFADTHATDSTFFAVSCPITNSSKYWTSYPTIIVINLWYSPWRIEATHLFRCRHTSRGCVLWLWLRSVPHRKVQLCLCTYSPSHSTQTAPCPPQRCR